MPLYIKDDATSELVAKLARLRGVSKQDAVKLAVMAELDAAFFILYGLARDEIDYVLSTFQGVVQEDEREGGVGQTRHLIHEAVRRLT